MFEKHRIWAHILCMNFGNKSPLESKQFNLQVHILKQLAFETKRTQSQLHSSNLSHEDLIYIRQQFYPTIRKIGSFELVGGKPPKKMTLKGSLKSLIYQEIQGNQKEYFEFEFQSGKLYRNSEDVTDPRLISEFLKLSGVVFEKWEKGEFERTHS